MPSPNGGAGGAVTIAPPLTRPFLDVCNLTISFSTDDGVVRAVEGLTFSVERGKTLGIVGESGSGKSVTTTGIMGLQRGKGARFSGEVWLDGEEVLHATPQRLRELRGERMSMIFQDPLSAMPLLHSGRADRRGLPSAPLGQPQGRSGPGRRDARPGWHPPAAHPGR